MRDETRAQIAETQDYLRMLPTEARARLCARLGVQGTDALGKVAAAVHAACLRPDVVERLVGTDLTEEVKRLLICWALRGPLGLETVLAQGGPQTTDPLEGGERARATVELAVRGLCIHEFGGLALLPCSYEPLAAFGIWAYGNGLADVLTRKAPLPFSLALAVGLSDVERPLAKVGGGLHVQSLKRLLSRMGDHGLAGLSWEGAHSMLSDLGVLVECEFGSTRALHVDVAALRATFAASPRAIAHATLWPLSAGRATLWTHARTLVAAQRATDAGEPPGATIRDILAIDVPAPYGPNEAQCLTSPDPWDTVRMLRNLVHVQLLEPVPGSNPVRVVPRDPPAHGTAAWVVQPTFEVLVPWDAPPMRVALLGLCADLEHVDRVCRYRLSPESIARGLEHLQEVDAILALLEEGAAAPLAQNVRATILGWAGRQRPLRSVRGELLLVADAAQAATIRELAPEARWITDQLVLLRDATLDPILAKARALGIPVAITEGSAPRRRGGVAMAAIPASRRAQDYLHMTLTVWAARSQSARRSASRSRPPPAEKRSAFEYLKELMRKVGIPVQDDDDDAADDEADDAADDDAEDGTEPAAETSSTAGPPSSSPTWDSLLPGPLRERLRVAIATGAAVQILFRNSDGRTVERRIVAVRLYDTPKGSYLDADDLQHMGRCTLALDRIVAIAAERG